MGLVGVSLCVEDFGGLGVMSEFGSDFRTVVFLWSLGA